MNCYHNSREALYRAPSGAQPCGTEITLRLRIDEEKQPDKVLLRVWYGQEHFYDMLPEEDDATLYWARLALPETPCLVWYDFHVWSEGQFFWYGNAEDGLGGEGAPVWGSARSFQITAYDPAFRAPEWTRGAVFYQIFPDRFRKDENALHRAGSRDMLAWETPVPYRADPETGDFQALDFYGGSLRGVAEKLPYLESLGVTAIYLNPSFEATSNHRYDTTDWMRIDSLLGDEADFAALCAAAEKRGIRVVLDGVFSHAGAMHPDFIAARHSREAKRFDWFLFNNWPDDYKCWWGFRNLPELNKQNDGVRRYFLSDEDSVVRHWLRAGSAGWRLDVADELPMDYLRQLRENARREREDAFVLGEVWEDASNKVSYGEMRCYCLGDTLDGVMNYPLREAALDFLTGKIPSEAFKRRMDSLYENYPAPFAQALLNLMGSHDRARVLNVLCGADGEEIPRAQRGNLRLNSRQREAGKRLLKMLLWLMCFMPGMPCVYYGDEAGMEGATDPFNRAPFPWGREDKELQTFFSETLRRYRASGVLLDGALAMEAPCAEILCVRRKLGEKSETLCLNRSSHARRVPVFGKETTVPARGWTIVEE